MQLTIESLDALGKAIAERQYELTSPVMDKTEAMQRARFTSEHSFDDWRAKHSIKPVGHKRYSRSQIERALKKECR